MHGKSSPLKDVKVAQLIKHTIIQKFEEQVQSHPWQTALVYEGKQISYRSLNEQANRMAFYLRKIGVKRESMVGICLEQSIEKVVALLAIIKAGGAYVPLDPNYPLSRITFMLKDTAAPFLITTTSLNSRVKNFEGHKILIDERAVQAAISTFPDVNPVKVNIPSDLAYVIYTSGSTGTPKGVLIEHQSLYHFILYHQTILGIDEKSKALQFSSMSFDAFVLDLWIPLLYGAVLYLYPDNRVIGPSLLNFIKKHEIDIIPFITPTVLASLPAGDAGQLKTLTIGGEASPANVLRDWTDKVRLINVYGPTETTVVACTFIYKTGCTDPIIGKAGPSVKLYILNANREPVKDGEEGELYIGGVQVARGYLNRLQLTAEVFQDDPFNDEEGIKAKMYKTGDKVKRLPDDNLQFLGRIDQQIKFRGFRIELGEIENVLSGIPGVRNAVLMVKENELQGPRLIAYLVHEQGLLKGKEAEKTINTLREVLKEQLPAHMIPANYLFIEKIPINANGKVDRKALTEWSVETEEFTGEDEVPANEYEATIKAVWLKALQLSGIRMTDDFFELGGNSIILPKVYQWLPETYREKLSVQDLFEKKTIRSLADEIQARINGSSVQTNTREELLEWMFRDAALLPGINITPATPRADITRPQHIFLTGATGFVGVNLLAELLENTEAKIYCLIRAQNSAHALERLSDTFRYFLLDPQLLFSDRVILIPGDLALPQFGISDQLFDSLAQKIDVIYHSGNSVSYLEPYAMIRKPNVLGLLELIRMATLHKVKGIFYISSLAVFSFGQYFTRKAIMTEDDDLYQNLDAISRGTNYVKTKWVAERILQNASSKGLPVMVFRPGFVISHSKTGATVMNQSTARLVRSSVALKVYPLLVGLKESLVSVDFVCKAIIHISRQPEAIGKNFHLSPDPENEVSMPEFFQKLNEFYNYGMVAAPVNEWRNRWKNDVQDEVFAIQILYNGDIHNGLSLMELYQNSYFFDCSNTKAFLSGTGIQCPKIDKALLDPYLKHIGVL